MEPSLRVASCLKNFESLFLEFWIWFGVHFQAEHFLLENETLNCLDFQMSKQILKPILKRLLIGSNLTESRRTNVLRTGVWIEAWMHGAHYIQKGKKTNPKDTCWPTLLTGGHPPPHPHCASLLLPSLAISQLPRSVFFRNVIAQRDRGPQYCPCKFSQLWLQAPRGGKVELRAIRWALRNTLYFVLVITFIQKLTQLLVII